MTFSKYFVAWSCSLSKSVWLLICSCKRFVVNKTSENYEKFPLKFLVKESPKSKDIHFTAIQKYRKEENPHFWDALTFLIEWKDWLIVADLFSIFCIDKLSCSSFLNVYICFDGFFYLYTYFYAFLSYIFNPLFVFVFWGARGAGERNMEGVWWVGDTIRYLYEFVSLVQAFPQFPLLSLSVLSVVLPGSLDLLLLLLSLPQLLPSVSELSCQRRHCLTVTLLLILFFLKKGKITFFGLMYKTFKSSLMLLSHLHHVLVFLQGCCEFSNLLTQGVAVSLSILQQG